MRECWIGAEGAKYLSEGLAVNKALVKLEYAACGPIPTVIPR